MKYDDTDLHLRYDKSRKLPEETKELWFESILEYVPAVNINTVIDMGCGTGRFLNTLRDTFPVTIYGIDPSVKMLTQAKKVCHDSHLSFIQCTAENSCVRDDSIDLAFLSQVYHHFHDVHRAIRELYRIMRQNGFLCIRNSVVENLDSCLYLRFFPGLYEKDEKLLASRDEIMHLLLQNDFSIIGHRIIHQKFAKDYQDYYNKIKLRGLSDLVLLPDDEFNEGINKLGSYCKDKDPDEPIYEEMDLYVAQKSL